MQVGRRWWWWQVVVVQVQVVGGRWWQVVVVVVVVVQVVAPPTSLLLLQIFDYFRHYAMPPLSRHDMLPHAMLMPRLFAAPLRAHGCCAAPLCLMPLPPLFAFAILMSR